MSAAILFFFIGCVFTSAIMAVVLRSSRKRIERLETLAKQSSQGSTVFRDKTQTLASALKDSVETISLYGRDDTLAIEFNSIEKVECTIAGNAKITAEIVDKTGSVANIASKMKENVLQGFSILEKNVKKMEDIKEKNSGAINGIVSLGNKVNKIRDIVRVINTITDQTKVIAFNAALEAASSGETGKRFSVVAGEVNRLADDIDVLTRQIREQVEEIQSSSSSLIMYSEEGSDKIAEGYKLIKDLEGVFMDIRDAAEITSNQAQTITVSTQEQLKSQEQIYADIAEIAGMVKLLIGERESAAKAAAALAERSRELSSFLAAEAAAAMPLDLNKINSGLGGYGD